MLSSLVYGQHQKIDSLENVLSQQKNIDTNRINTLNRLAYYYNGDNQQKLKVCALEALNLSLKLKYKGGEAGAYIGLSHVYINDNANPLALVYFDKAYAIYKTLNDKPRCSGVLSGIAIYYASVKDYKLSMDYDLRALAEIKGLRKYSREVYCLSNIGDDYEKTGQFEKALQYYNSALALALKINTSEILPFCYLNLASIYLHLQKYTVALGFCNKVFSFQKADMNISAKEIAQTNLVAAQIYYGLKNYNKAIQSLDVSDSIIQKTQVLDNRLKLYYVRYLLDSATHHYQEALQQSYLYHRLGDSIISINKTRVIALYNYKIELQKDEDEKQRLRVIADKDKSIISKQHIIQTILWLGLLVICCGLIYLKRAYDELRKSNVVKDKLFSIIAHDLRSPIAQVIGLINLWESGDLDHNEISTLLPEVKGGVTGTLELLDNLLMWSKNQLQGFNFNPLKFDLYVLVTQTIKDLDRLIANKQIRVNNSISPGTELYADHEMLKIVLRNLISNAIKFTPNAGSITIGSYIQKRRIVIVVEDTGVGIKKNNQHKIFSLTTHTTPGTANEKGTGIGLKICQEFVGLNKGKIWFESKENVGSRFYISFPVVL